MAEALSVLPPARGAILTVDEVSARLRVSKRSVQRWLQRGELARVQLGRYVRVFEADVELFIEQHRTGGA